MQGFIFLVMGGQIVWRVGERKKKKEEICRLNAAFVIRKPQERGKSKQKRTMLCLYVFDVLFFVCFVLLLF